MQSRNDFDSPRWHAHVSRQLSDTRQSSIVQLVFESLSQASRHLYDESRRNQPDTCVFLRGALPAMEPRRRFSPSLGLLLIAAFGLATLETPALAQQRPPGVQLPGAPGAVSQGIRPGQPGFATRPAAAAPAKLEEPSEFRVYQRDSNGKAEIPIALAESVKDGKLISAMVSPTPGNARITFSQADSKLLGVPTGGPYTIHCQVKTGENVQTVAVHNVFVGDLWVLAGQSNMEGVGDLIDVTPPNPRVMLLGMDGHWGMAEEPLHWLVDSPDPVHSGNPADSATRSAHVHKNRPKGAGLGLPFAVAHGRITGVPVGLVACAHGGTSMEQWNPSKKEQGGHSLYGSMLRQVKAAGGKVKGVLWYQGESDAIREATSGRSTPRCSRTSSGRPRPTSASPTCRSTSCRSAGSSAAAIPAPGTPCRTPSARSPSACPTRRSSR